MHHRSLREFILPIASMFRNQRPNWLYKSQLPTVLIYLETCLRAKEWFLLDFMSLEKGITYSQPLILGEDYSSEAKWISTWSFQHIQVLWTLYSMYHPLLFQRYIKIKSLKSPFSKHACWFFDGTPVVGSYHRKWLLGFTFKSQWFDADG
jgi:hypothetical protein